MNSHEVMIHLRVVLLDLDLAIDQVRRDYPNQPFKMMDPNGRYILLDALAAKANALAAIARLEEI